MDKVNFVDLVIMSMVVFIDFDNSLYVYLENICLEIVKSFE